jgi:hypothetical protein
MAKKTTQANAQEEQVRELQPEQAQAQIPGMEKQILMSVLIDYVGRCKYAIEQSVSTYIKEHQGDEQEIHNAQNYINGAQQMYELIMRGILNAPVVQHQVPAPNRQQRRANARKQHKEVQQ